MAFPEGFEWDEVKRQANLSKHDIDFRDLWEMFERPVHEDYDHRHSGREDRWRVIGILHGRCVFCVYTWRDGRRRIVTVRQATRDESMLYFRYFWFEPLS
ncbi:MAG: BrnT family toxin [Proteobacteria bacterium]|nr:BrnT family toxin [Pseudomonadota bacterium]